jgi:hypothetical protein
MDVNLLIEVHQYYINSLKQKIQHTEHKPPPTVVGASASALARTVTLEISRQSCNSIIIEFYDETSTLLVPQKQEVPTQANTSRKILYTFPRDVHIQRVRITRPVCTNMSDSKIKIVDSNGTTTYESLPINETQGRCHIYTFNVPNTVPITQ